MNSRTERGSTLVVVLVLLVALLAVGALVLRAQLRSTKSAGLAKNTKQSLYCAEAGLAAARARVGESYAQWPILLDGNPDNDPVWYPITGDMDGDGTVDYEVRIKDNDDEPPPRPNDPTTDNDLRIFVVSRCVSDPNTPQQVMELIQYEGGGTIYRDQSGHGQGNTGNVN